MITFADTDFELADTEIERLRESDLKKLLNPGSGTITTCTWL